MPILRGRALAPFVVLGLACGFVAPAFAFCRQRTCTESTRVVCDDFEDPNACSTVVTTCQKDALGCVSEGALFFRDTTCLSYAVARGNAAAFGLRDDEFAKIVGEAFARWSNVDCGGGQKPGLTIQSAGLVEARGAYFCPEVALNTNTWFLTRPWTRDAALLGYNQSTSSSSNGQIFDADVELNVDKILKDFPNQNRSDVLLAVATHEAGHFLGLAHSLDTRAVMFAEYSVNGLSKRELTADDIAGICAVFPPLPGAAQCDAPGIVAAGLEARACEEAMSGAASGTGGESSIRTGGASSDDGRAPSQGCSFGAGPGAGLVWQSWLLAAAGLLRFLRRDKTRKVWAEG